LTSSARDGTGAAVGLVAALVVPDAAHLLDHHHLTTT
jgi:hypothetical protein